jgi:hypothetical protein
MGVNTSVRARDVRVSPVTAEVFAVTAAGAGGGGWAAAARPVTCPPIELVRHSIFGFVRCSSRAEGVRHRTPTDNYTARWV